MPSFYSPVVEVFYVLIGTGKQNILTLLYEAIVLGQESKGLL